MSKTKTATKEATLTLVVTFDPTYLEEVKAVVDEARGFGTIVSAKVMIPSETEIDVSDGL